MKMLVRCLALSGAIAMLGVAPVKGQPVFSFDEFGNGAFGAGVLQPDPSGGLLSWNVLVYTLPFPGTVGDVLMHEPAVGNAVLDVIRFDGNGHLIFYSDNVDGFDAPGDTPSPPNPLFPNQANITEGGVVGGIQDAFYAPNPGQPGWDPALAPGSTYHFISDAPEPGSVALLLVGLGLFGIRRRRQAGAA